MLGFWGTIKIALRLPHAKLYAAVMVLGSVAAFTAPKLISNQKIAMFAMMLILFISSVCIEQFCAYIRAVRMEDIKRNSGKTKGKKKSGNRC